MSLVQHIPIINKVEIDKSGIIKLGANY